jgi:hypothetical protein
MDTNIYIACLRQVVAFAPKVIIIACLRQGFCIRKTRYKMRRLRRRTREGCGFGSLMKQKIKAKTYAVFCFARTLWLLFQRLLYYAAGVM